MAATYQVITEAEMDAYVGGLGFKQILIPGTKEKVFAKRVDVHGLVLSMRIYSSIQHGKGRKVGGDAIKCELVWRVVPETAPDVDEIPFFFVVGRSVRVHRTQGWKANLAKRINDWYEMLGPPCPGCGAPMLVREGTTGEFYGCSTYKEGWCRVTRPLTYNPERGNQ
jgi:hypothetical protein